MVSPCRSRQSVTPCRRQRSRFPPAPVSTRAHAGTNSASCASHPRAFAAHDRDMRLLACLFLLAACVCLAPATRRSSCAPIEDVGIPFLCDWGYDRDERCYRDDSARLPVGGVDDDV